MRIVAVVLIFTIGLLLVGAGERVPNYVNALVTQNIEDHLPENAAVSVELRSFPVFKLLLGAVDEFHLRFANFSVSNFLIDRFEVHGQNIKINIPQLAKK